MKRDPPTYLSNFLKENNIEFDVDIFQADDLPFCEVLFRMPVNKIHLFANPTVKRGPQSKPFSENSKFKDFMKIIGKTIENSETVKSLIIEKIPLKVKHLKILN